MICIAAAIKAEAARGGAALAQRKEEEEARSEGGSVHPPQNLPEPELQPADFSRAALAKDQLLGTWDSRPDLQTSQDCSPWPLGITSGLAA